MHKTNVPTSLRGRMFDVPKSRPGRILVNVSSKNTLQHSDISMRTIKNRFPEQRAQLGGVWPERVNKGGSSRTFPEKVPSIMDPLLAGSLALMTLR